MPRQIDQIAQTPEAYAAKLREVLDHPAAEQSAGARVGLRCFLQMQWLKGLQPAVASAAYALLTPAELLKVLRAHCEAVEELVAESSPSQPAPAPSAAAAMSASTSSLAATPHMRQLLLLMCAAHLDYLVQVSIATFAVLIANTSLRLLLLYCCCFGGRGGRRIEHFLRDSSPTS